MTKEIDGLVERLNDRGNGTPWMEWVERNWKERKEAVSALLSQAARIRELEAEKSSKQELVNVLFSQNWQHDCVIGNLKWTHDGEDGGIKCAAAFDGDGRRVYLRHSKGPLQGWSWDIYPDDLHTTALAVLAISQAPAPFGADLMPTHGNAPRRRAATLQGGGDE